MAFGDLQRDTRTPELGRSDSFTQDGPTVCWRKLSLTNLFGRIKSKKKTGNTTEWVISWGEEYQKQEPNLKKECICLPVGDPKTPASESGTFGVRGLMDVGTLVFYKQTWVNEDCKNCIDPVYCPCEPTFSVPLVGGGGHGKRKETTHTTTNPPFPGGIDHGGQISQDMGDIVYNWVEETVRANQNKNWKCNDLPEL